MVPQINLREIADKAQDIPRKKRPGIKVQVFTFAPEQLRLSCRSQNSPRWSGGLCREVDRLKRKTKKGFSVRGKAESWSRRTNVPAVSQARSVGGLPDAPRRKVDGMAWRCTVATAALFARTSFRRRPPAPQGDKHLLAAYFVRGARGSLGPFRDMLAIPTRHPWMGFARIPWLRRHARWAASKAAFRAESEQPRTG